MAKHVTIPLAEPLLGHHGAIHKVVVREPTFEDYIDLGGDPYTVARSAEGAAFVVEDAEKVRAYVNRCIVEPTDKLILEKASFRVARAVKEAVLSFFLPEPAAGGASATSPTTSSSPAAGSPGSGASTPTPSAA